MDVVREFWEREGRNSVFVALNPSNPEKLPYLYRFLREQGVRPNADRVLLRDRSRAYFDISAVFPRGLNCTKSFWNGTTHVEGQCMSLTLEHADESEANMRKLTVFPLLMTTNEYYGETRLELNPTFTPREDREGPLCLAAAVTRGNPKYPNDMSTLMVLGSTDMLLRENARAEQRDYLYSLWSWMSARPEYAGKSANHDMTVKIDLNRHSRSMLETLTLLVMPLLALLIALIIWNTRRH